MRIFKRDIPDANGVIIASRGKLVVLAKGEACNPVRMPLNGFKIRVFKCDIPDANGFIPASRGKFVVLAKGEACNRARMSC